MSRKKNAPEVYELFVGADLSRPSPIYRPLARFTGRFCERPFDTRRGRGGVERCGAPCGCLPSLPMRMWGPLRVPSVPLYLAGSFPATPPCQREWGGCRVGALAPPLFSLWFKYRVWLSKSIIGPLISPLSHKYNAASPLAGSSASWHHNC